MWRLLLALLERLRRKSYRLAGAVGVYRLTGMVTRLTHGKKPDLVDTVFQALGRSFSLTGVAASLRAARKMVVPDKIPYLLQGYPASLSKPAPVWSSVPTFSFSQSSQPVTYPLGVSAGGAVITMSWVSTPMTGVTFTNGVSPSITFTSATTQTASITLRATANGQTADSAGTITVSVSSGAWSPAVSAFTQGSTAGSPQQISLPSGYAAGGVYDKASGTFPAGVTLSDSGSLAYDGAGAVGSQSVIFGYTEHGALPTLTLHGTGTDLPYMATVYPAEGAVPSGFTVSSPDDTTMRSSTLSTWPDGSAQVMVVAGSKTVSTSTPIRVRATATATGTNLTTAAISAAVSSVAVNFGTAYSLTNFASPDFIWWQNPQVICARYRLAIANKGVMEAVIDIHAFQGGRAFVEVVIENSKMNTSSPSAPASQTYTGATVSVNGATIATVSSSAAPNGTHNNFRAWYCSGWVGGDPGVTVTHDTASMQALPYFWKPARSMTTNYATLYGSESYAPWSTERYPTSDMGATGEGSRGWIGPFSGWESDYICSGNVYAARAVLQNAPGLLTFNINYRDSTTNLVPSPSQLSGKVQGSNWPAIDYGTGGTAANFEAAHQPVCPVVAFLCRPSPCFIEIAQKMLVWNHTETSTPVPTWDQPRSKGWRFRNYAYATFLTPNTNASFSSWITSARSLLVSSTAFFTVYDVTANTLDAMYQYRPNDYEDHGGSDYAGFTSPMWMHAYSAISANSAAKMKLLRGADQTTYDAAVDWVCTYPVRYVNEATNGEYRLILYTTRIGDLSGGALINMAATWGAMMDSSFIDSPPASSGPWLSLETSSTANPSNYNRWAGASTQSSAGISYTARFYAALVAAKERGISGADTAWARVYGTAENGQITNFTTWANSFADNPIYNRVAR